MRFGTAKDIITPIEPTMLACAKYFDRTYTEIHDDLYVRTLVIDDGKSKAVLMSFDLIFHNRDLNREIAEYAHEKYGISPAAVVVTHTHSHPTPATPSYNPYNPMSVNPSFEALIRDRAKRCLDRAMLTMFEGSAEYGSFDADFNVSRRGKVNGVYKISPAPDYVCDKEFFVLCVKDTEGRIRNITCNYPCHPVFYPTEYMLSGEFPGRVSQLLESEYWSCVAMYTQSSAGDVRPRPCIKVKEDGTLKFQKLPFEAVDAFAKDISASVISFIEKREMKPIDFSIAADEFSIRLEIEPKPIEAFAEKLEFERTHNMPGNADWENAKHAVEGGYDEMPEHLDVWCQTLRLSEELYVATIGGEPCFGVKNVIKSVFGGKDVCFIGYTDDCAYLVDDKVLAEGGYEPGCHIEYNLKGPFKPGLDTKYFEGFEKSLERIKI